MKDIEKLAATIMKECENDGEPVTKEEALEMARMELNAKSERHYEQADIKEKKERKPRERKVDEEKKHILSCVKTLIEGMKAENVVMKTETELSFIFGGNNYTLKLTKHRAPKK